MQSGEDSAGKSARIAPEEAASGATLVVENLPSKPEVPSGEHDATQHDRSFLRAETFFLLRILGWMMLVLGAVLLVIHVLGESGWVLRPHVPSSEGPALVTPTSFYPEFRSVEGAEALGKWSWKDRMSAWILVSDACAVISACVFAVFAVRASRLRRGFGGRYGGSSYLLCVPLALFHPLLGLSVFFPLSLGLFFLIPAWRLRLRWVAVGGLGSAMVYFGLVFFVPAGFAFLATGIVLLATGFRFRDAIGSGV